MSTNVFALTRYLAAFGYSRLLESAEPFELEYPVFDELAATANAWRVCARAGGIDLERVELQGHRPGTWAAARDWCELLEAVGVLRSTEDGGRFLPGDFEPSSTLELRRALLQAAIHEQLPGRFGRALLSEGLGLDHIEARALMCQAGSPQRARALTGVDRGVYSTFALLLEVFASLEPGFAYSVHALAQLLTAHIARVRFEFGHALRVDPALFHDALTQLAALFIDAVCAPCCIAARTTLESFVCAPAYIPADLCIPGYGVLESSGVLAGLLGSESFDEPVSIH